MTDTTSSDAETAAPGDPYRLGLPSSSRRYGAFTDAVVAIAMTLLILPMMEAVPEGDADISAVQFLAEHTSQIIGFLLSFVLIGMFWFVHHSVFREDTPYSPWLALINFAWMITIVWLPVATAIIGPFGSQRTAMALYVGTMAVGSWLLFALAAMQLAARRRAQLPNHHPAILATPLAMSVMFTVILAVQMIHPALSYWPLFAMILTGPVRGVVARIIRARVDSDR